MKKLHFQTQIQTPPITIKKNYIFKLRFKLRPSRSRKLKFQTQIQTPPIAITKLHFQTQIQTPPITITKIEISNSDSNSTHHDHENYIFKLRLKLHPSRSRK